MKNLFKMTTAALALVAFASCSNDELFGSKNSPEAKNFTSILEYEIEEPDGLAGTRAARNAEGKGFVFQEGDQLRVYDEDLGKFDTYTFATQFGREGDTKLQKDPAYALFPYGDIRKGYCDADGNHIAEIKIGKRVNAGANNEFQVIEYSNEAGSETKVGDNVLYKCNVPMWGTVTKIDASTVKADQGLKPLTGVLMLTLGKALNNATWVRLHTDAGFLGGTFYANLDDAEPALYINDANEYLDLSKDLYIDLRKVPSDLAVLYIPVVAGINDLKVYRTLYNGADPTDIDGNGITDILSGAMISSTPSATQWTMISTLAGYTFKRNGYKKVNYEYTLAATQPEDISLTMEQLKAQTEDLELNLADKLVLTDGTLKQDWDKNTRAFGAYVKAKGTGTDDIIYMPKMAAETVILNITKGVDAIGNLMIVDADAANPFTGTLVVNVAVPTPTSDFKAVSFDIDLPNAAVVLNGPFHQTAADWTINSITADELEIGNGDPTEITTTNMDLSGVKTAININKDATFTGTIDSKAATTYFAPITIKGKVAGNINTNGDVNVELAAPDDAITGTLKFYRGGTTCTLKQGYIGTITNDFSALGEANDHEVTVKLDDAEGITAIGNVNVDKTYWPDDAKITLTESTLSIAAKKCTVIPPAYLAANKVYTAAMLEQLHQNNGNTPATITICNDLNMANAAWTTPFANVAIAAAGDWKIESEADYTTRTIKNLSYNGYRNNNNNTPTSPNAVGFFGNVQNLTVEDIKFDNVSFTKDYFINDDQPAKSFRVDFVGGICGQATGDVTITRSTVNLADNFGYSSYAVESHTANPSSIPVDAKEMGIGGFVGRVRSVTPGIGNITLTKAAVSGAMIQGYTSLGGFFGVVTPIASQAISFDKDCVSNIAAFKSNYSNPAANDNELNLWRAAAGIGYIAFAAPAVPQTITIGTGTTAPKATPVVITVPAGKEGRNFVGLGTGAGQTLWSYTKGQNWIGFCGTESAPGLTTTSNQITIGADTYEVPQVAGTAFAPVATAGDKNLYNWVKKN